MLRTATIFAAGLQHALMRTNRRLVLLILLTPPLLVALLTTIGPLRLDPVAAWAGIGIGHQPGLLPGFVSIDPNMGTTSFALGFRAARDLLSGTLPLWNHFEGLGTPLLGEMQSAALFPPTWLLALPYGQAIEHALLQAVAGLGTYLFLRRFGLGTAAALAGGLLFEFNGVFAWLRNAVYNPVAFLPWLLYVIESLYRLARLTDRRPIIAPGRRPIIARGRRPIIATGAIMAALSLYAGFPELVYFNAMLMAAWAALRAAALPWRRALVFAADLLAVAILALLLASPVLIAFAHFLREAAVGGHQGTEFVNHVLPPQAFLLTLLPYVFGPISAAPQPAVATIWGDIGGYLGLTPFLLATAGLACTWRRPTTWLLTAWIVLAVGASHGVPLLHGAFTALPLVAIAAFCRYLDASWIFACIVLAAIFIDRVPTMPPPARRRVTAIAGTVTLGLLALGLHAAWPLLAEIWTAQPWQGRAILVSLAAAITLPCLFLLATRRRDPALPLAALAVAEAILLFMLPFASIPRFSGPRFSDIDRPLIQFLRDHAGLQRFAIATGSGLGPNFGSVYGIPSMNYDDLPVPARTARYVTTRLDATNDGVIFGHNAPPADEADRQARRSAFLAALPGYAQAGVRYILSRDPLDAHPAYPLAADGARPLSLHAGQQTTVDIDSPGPALTIGTASITIGTYGGRSDGTLRLRLCQDSRCVTGATPLANAPDNSGLPIHLDSPLTLAPDTPLHLTITKEGGQNDVALWMHPTAPPRTPPEYRPVIDWIDAASPVPVLRTRTTSIYELSTPRPYAAAAGCTLDIATHDRIAATCAAPARLLRLEVFSEGWHARVNGIETPILPMEETFQGVDLPAGSSTLDFTYAPTFLRPSLPIALLTLALCLAMLARPRPRSLR